MIIRKIHKIDATGKAAGRLATQIAIILRGKNKPEYEPHLDKGDAVEVSNIDKLKFTGKKLEQKKYFRYSGYPGGLKTTKLSELKEKEPAQILKRAVKQMLPANKLRNNMMKRLIIK
ncbi:50S ribosomal protein L13 [Candidatus Falkowbacteria bacterium]|nr:50S ribosomal protein L13 [Candidatus Falkowbacteria bacterium]